MPLTPSRLFSIAAIFALLTLGVTAAPKPIRLYQVLAVRFATDVSGQHVEVGLYDSLGQFRVVDRTPLPAGVIVPSEALGRFLITGPSWFAYDVLGPDALKNFKIGSPIIFVGEQGYLPIAVADSPKLDVGDLVNISTRAAVVPGDDPVIGGFVVVGSPRRVLIRGVGPGLGPLGVRGFAVDPSITLHKQGSTSIIASNDDWAAGADANAIEQAAISVGAFPISRGSKDAACLLELEPGVYTVHLTTSGTASGTALLEVYTLP